MIHQLRLTQTEYSLMAGHSLAFNGMAALSSLVAGPLADQLHRPRFLAFGMLVLSITTAAVGAASFKPAISRF
jgi:MFS family permease